MSKGRLIGLIIALVVLVGATISALLLLGAGNEGESDENSSKKNTSETSTSTTAEATQTVPETTTAIYITTTGATDTTAGATATTESDVNSTPITIGKEKIFSKSGLSITLTEDFVEKSLMTQTAYYESMTSIVTTLKEPFENLAAIGLNKDSTLRDYAQAVINTNGFNNQGTYVQEGDGFTGFEYTSEVTGATISYIAVVFKTNDSFWLVQFACEQENYQKFSPIFNQWAKSVVFT